MAGGGVTEAVRSVAELSESLGVTPSSIYAWLKKGCPRLPDGGFDLAAVEQWRASRRRPPKLDDENRADGSGLSPATEKYREFKALDAELKYRERVGELVERAKVDRDWADLGAAMKRDLRAVGRRLSRRLTNIAEPREIQRIIEDAIDNCLRHWAQGKSS